MNHARFNSASLTTESRQSKKITDSIVTNAMYSFLTVFFSFEWHKHFKLAELTSDNIAQIPTCKQKNLKRESCVFSILEDDSAVFIRSFLVILGD